MRINELLQEAPVYGKGRLQPIDVMSKHYGDKKRFVSYTDLPKLGLNPRTDFESTPAGVYGYPLAYVLDRADKLGTTYGAVPFAEDRKYVIMFSVSGTVIDVSKHSLTRQEQSKLAEYIKLHPRMSANADEIWRVATQNGSNTYMAYRAVQELAELQRASGDSKRITIILSNICRFLGWDALVDHGGGLIHIHEPHQCVVINPTTVKNIEIFDNKPPTAGLDDGMKSMLAFANEKMAKFDNMSIIQNTDAITRNHKQIQNAMKEVFEIYEMMEENIPPSQFRTHVWPSVDKSIGIIHKYYKRFEILKLTKTNADVFIRARQQRIVKIGRFL